MERVGKRATHELAVLHVQVKRRERLAVKLVQRRAAGQVVQQLAVLLLAAELLGDVCVVDVEKELARLVARRPAKDHQPDIFTVAPDEPVARTVRLAQIDHTPDRVLHDDDVVGMNACHHVVAAQIHARFGAHADELAVAVVEVDGLDGAVRLDLHPHEAAGRVVHKLQ